jgi:hypothetical protein
VAISEGSTGRYRADAAPLTSARRPGDVCERRTPIGFGWLHALPLTSGHPICRLPSPSSTPQRPGMLKTMREELLSIFGGHISIPVSLMSINILLYDPGFTLTSNVTSLIFASPKLYSRMLSYLLFLHLVLGKSLER